MSDEMIVVIDGNQTMRKQVCSLLVGSGHQVLPSVHGVDAVRKLRGVTPSLFLIDQEVPLGGLRTACILRLNPKYRAAPFLLSASVRRDRAATFIREAREVGIGNIVTSLSPENKE